MSEANDNASKRRRKTIDELHATLVSSSAPKPRQFTRKGASGTTINGNGNIVGNNNSIIIVSEQKKARGSARPGIDHITDEQHAYIQQLVSECAKIIVQREGKKNAHGAIYSQLFSFLGGGRRRVRKLELVPLAQFDEAVSWLQQRKAMLDRGNPPSERSTAWRKRCYAYIMADADKLYSKERLWEHCLSAFGTPSLRELSDDELQSLYDTVTQWKRRARRERA